MEEVKLEGILEGGQFGRVGVKIKVRDGVSVAVFSNPKLGKALGDAERRAGNKNITWIERGSWLVEKHPNLTQKEIVAKLMRELKLEVK